MYDEFLFDLKKDINLLKSSHKKVESNTHINIIDILEENSKLEINEWTDNNLQLIHVLLHKHFKYSKHKKSSGDLHKKIIVEMQKRNISHVSFDDLDNLSI